MVLPERLAMMLVRPHGTTREAGYDDGQSGGRPHGTTPVSYTHLTLPTNREV